MAPATRPSSTTVGWVVQQRRHQQGGLLLQVPCCGPELSNPWGDKQDLLIHNPGSETNQTFWSDSNGSLSVTEDGSRRATFTSQENSAADTVDERQFVVQVQRSAGLCDLERGQQGRGRRDHGRERGA